MLIEKGIFLKNKKGNRKIRLKAYKMVERKFYNNKRIGFFIKSMILVDMWKKLW